jgi:hypothetical protein
MRYDAQEGYAAVSNARPTEIKPWSVGDKRYHKRMARSRYTIERVLGSIQCGLGRLES